jgi:DNA-directed RNA polymerase subunit K/omega
MTDYKKSSAAKSTVTINSSELGVRTGNVYEAVAIIGKRSVQIGEELRQELHEKLEDFNVHTESLEEIFENKEQIELSRLYEALPKPTSLAIQEWLEGKIYFRNPSEPTKD